jgi:predicted outer membrane lipoprotein
MLFLLGLFLGCVFGIIVASLCIAAREQDQNISVLIGSEKNLEGAA